MNREQETAMDDQPDGEGDEVNDAMQDLIDRLRADYIGREKGLLDHLCLKAASALETQRAELAERATDPREFAHIACDCVPDLGPEHCHLCGKRAGHPVPWTECASRRVEVTEEMIERGLKVSREFPMKRGLDNTHNVMRAVLEAALGGGEHD